MVSFGVMKAPRIKEVNDGHNIVNVLATHVARSPLVHW